MDENSSEFDVFQWANAVDEVKNNVSVELFLFNKNYTPYKVRYSDALMQTIKSLFMLEAVEFINKEADKGLECREYELSDGEDKVIYRIELSKVGRAETLIHLIEHEYKDIAHPIKLETREHIQKLILDKYQVMLAEEQEA